MQGEKCKSLNLKITKKKDLPVQNHLQPLNTSTVANIYQHFKEKMSSKYYPD